jgi:hypothetical protein
MGRFTQAENHMTKQGTPSLNSQGFHVVRLGNEEFTDNAAIALAIVKDALEKAPSP